MTDELAVFGEFRYWIPVDGTDFAGDILRYGVGANYLLYQNKNIQFRPILEFVGWTVLSGKETAALTPTVFDIRSARGDTIVNAKIGGRLNFGQYSQIYIGYGRALTGEVWYKDLLRVEYGLSF
jgi:hypothetical protein